MAWKELRAEDAEIAEEKAAKPPISLRAIG
jgi:hypothetical protein